MDYSFDRPGGIGTMAGRKTRGRITGNRWPERLREWRNAQGFSQRAAAKLAHIAQGQWSKYESGLRIPTRPIEYILEALLQGKELPSVGGS